GKHLRRAIRDYTSRLRQLGPAAVGVIYYAGHGMQVRENNYLLPIDADIRKESDAAIEAVHLTDVLNALYDAGNRMNLIILDACRDNPYRKRLRLAANGLAGFDAPIGTLIAYSTAPGHVALDGAGANSPFAESLAAALVEKPASIEMVFKKTREAVYRKTQQAQVPWESSSLVGDFIVAAQATPGSSPLAGAAGAHIAGRNGNGTAVRAADQHTETDPDGRLAYFVEWKYLGGESGATPLEEGAYADLVDYYGKARVTRADLMRDKRRYYQRWPNRRYKMFKETLAMRAIAPGLFDVFFEYAFDVENDSKRIHGRGNASLLLQQDKGAYLILREAGDVLKRTVIDKTATTTRP
ncbi:MAG: caspase domain-containing protein, partial [Hyphomicrobiaceae bacterium]